MYVHTYIHTVHQCCIWAISGGGGNWYSMFVGWGKPNVLMNSKEGIQGICTQVKSEDVIPAHDGVCKCMLYIVHIRRCTYMHAYVRSESHLRISSR